MRINEPTSHTCFRFGFVTIYGGAHPSFKRLEANTHRVKQITLQGGNEETRRYLCQLSFGQPSLGFAPLASRQARDAALGANASETLAAPGTLGGRG